MKPVVNYFYRRSGKSKKKKKAPVCLTVRLNSKINHYTTGLDLTLEEYEAAHAKRREGQALVHSIQISTAHARMKAIAELMEPFLFEAFAYIIKKVKKEYKESFIDQDFNFNPYIATAKYLEQYKNSNPGTIIPALLPSTDLSYTERKLAPLNAYAANVTSCLSLVPATTQTSIAVQAKPFTNNRNTPTNPIIIDEYGNEIINPANNGAIQNIQINHFHITTTGNSDTGNQLALPSTQSKYNPDANVIPWIINSMDKLNGSGTENGYKNASQKLFIYAIIKKCIKKVDNEYILTFRSTTNIFLESFEKWLLREGKSWTLEGEKLFKNNEEWKFTEEEEEEEEEKEEKKSTLKGMKRNGARTYLSYIKSAFALAVEEGIILPKENPFNKRRYIIPKGEKQDRSLTPQEWKAVLKCKPSVLQKQYSNKRAISEAEMLAMMLLCYCLSGINLVDIAMMRCSQIQKFILNFTRRKMIRKKGLGEVTLKLNERIQELFAKWGTPIDKKTGSIKVSHPDAFVFPILTRVFPTKKWEEMSEQEKQTWQKEYEIYEEQTITHKRKMDPPSYPLKNIENMKEEEKQAWDREEYEEYKKQIAAYGVRINRFLKKILEKAGFDPTGITFYSIRHTFTNDALEAGVEVDQLMKLLGQASYEAFTHYNNRLQKRTTTKIDNMTKIQKIPTPISNKKTQQPQRRTHNRAKKTSAV